MREFAKGVQKGFTDTMSATVKPVKQFVDTMTKKQAPMMSYSEARRLDPKMAVREGEIVNGKVYRKPPQASAGAPPSRRTGRGAYSVMKKMEPMAMSQNKKMMKMEPLKKIDYENDFEKAFNKYLPSKKKSRNQMSTGKQNFRDVAQNKADRAVLTKGMKK